MVVIVALSTAKSIAKPIQALQKGTETIGSGDLNCKVGTDAKDEVGQLSRAFDRMTQNLAEITSKLHKEIEERKKAEEELNRKSQELQALTKDLRKMSGQLSKEDELSRRKFAKILHEQMGQNLIGMRIKCHDLMKGTISNKAEIKKTAKNVISLIDDTIRSTRELTTELYPVILDNLGFIPAVTWYKELVLESRKLKVLTHIDSSVECLSSEYKLSLFRIVQEAFQNIAKHASATDVKMELRKKDNNIQLTIKDNGVGFDLKKIKEKKDKGIGQMLIKERVLSLGGSLYVESVLDKGTEIKVSIPVEK